MGGGKLNTLCEEIGTSSCPFHRTLSAVARRGDFGDADMWMRNTLRDIEDILIDLRDSPDKKKILREIGETRTELRELAKSVRMLGDNISELVRPLLETPYEEFIQWYYRAHEKKKGLQGTADTNNGEPTYMDSLVEHSEYILALLGLQVLDGKCAHDAKRDLIMAKKETKDKRRHGRIAEVLKPGIMKSSKVLRRREIVLYEWNGNGKEGL